MWGISRGFVLIQDGGDHSHNDFWEYFSKWERTQEFIGICRIRRIVMQIYTSINLGHGLACENGFNKASQESLLGKRYNIEMPMIFCSAAP